MSTLLYIFAFNNGQKNTIMDSEKNDNEIKLSQYKISSNKNGIEDVEFELISSELHIYENAISEEMIVNMYFNRGQMDMHEINEKSRFLREKGYFDIVKLELTKYLEFALSTTNEDMFIKNNLENKLPYFILLNKICLVLLLKILEINLKKKKNVNGLHQCFGFYFLYLQFL